MAKRRRRASPASGRRPASYVGQPPGANLVDQPTQRHPLKSDEFLVIELARALGQVARQEQVHQLIGKADRRMELGQDAERAAS